MLLNFIIIFYLHLRTCLLILAGGWGKRKRERNINAREKHWLVASPMCLDQGPNPKPRHVPWPGTEFMIFRFMGWCSNQLSHMSQGWKVMFLQEQLSQYDLKHLVGPIQVVPLSSLNYPLIPEYPMGSALGVSWRWHFQTTGWLSTGKRPERTRQASLKIRHQPPLHWNRDHHALGGPQNHFLFLFCLFVVPLTTSKNSIH